MNNTYRLVWNATLGLWQAAPETAKGRGKSKSTRALRPLLAGAALSLAASAFAAPVLPTDGNVTAGTGSITQTGNTTTIDQASSKLAIDWQGFSIGQGGTVVFRQPSANAVALNRVLGSDPSVIQGALRANGQVFLLNPNGVLFSPGAQVDTGGLLASTLDMKTGDFLDGRYLLEGASANAVVNQGALRAAHGGSVALVAAQVTNTGSIDAPAGGVALGAASQVLVDLGGPVKLQLQKAAVDTLVENGGAIRADGGTVLLTAKAASELAGSAINQSGTIRAQTLATGERGEILLLGDMRSGTLDVGGTLDASAPVSGDGGFIETSAAHVANSAGLNVSAGAAHGRGGEWLVDPYDYVINAAAATNISNTLNTGTSVTITTQASNPQYGAGASGSGDITVSSAIAKTAGGDAVLTLRADRNVIVGADIGATTGKLGLTLSAGNGAGIYGGVRVNGNLRSNGGDILIGGARGTSNQGIGFAGNLNASEAAVVVEQNKSILSTGGHITINGRSTVGSNNGSYSAVTGGVYIKSGAKILSGAGDLYITGESSAGLKTFGLGFEANAGTNTVVGSATNGGNMLMNGVNSAAGTAAERDQGAIGLVNYGSVERLSFYGPSVASWLVFVNGVPQLSGYTRTPQLNCVNGYLNCGYLVVPGSNNSYLYAGYQSVDMATKAAYVIQSGAGTKVYDGSTLATNLTLSGLGGPAGFTPASLQPAPLFHTTSKNVGTYTRLARDAANPTSLAAGGETYAVGYFNSGSYQITPRTLTPTVANKVYDGTSSAAVTATGVIGTDDVRLQGIGSFGGSVIGQYDNVSVSGIVLDGQDAANYTLGSNTVSGMSGSILRREVTLNASKTYDGSDSLAGVLAIGNLVAGEQLNYSGAHANSAHVDGATHVSGITLLDGANGVAANYILPSLSAASNANRAAIAPRVLGVSAGGLASKTYDGSTAAPLGFQPAFALTGLAAADANATVAVGATGMVYNSANVLDADRLIVSGMSVTGVSGGVANASDYVLASNSGQVAARIDPRALSIAADAASKVYGERDPQLGYRILAGSLVGGDSLSGQVVRSAGENVGSYTIDASSLTNPNYAVSASGAALTVTPRAITVAADDANKIYGELDPQFGYRILAGSLVGGDTLSGALTRAAGENVGSYVIDAAALANGNYLVTAINGTLTVAPRALTVAVNDAAKRYGDADPLLGYRIVSGSLVGNDVLGGAPLRALGEDAGSYAIDGSSLANGNYVLTVTDGRLTIAQRPIAVGADAVSKLAGAADPQLTWRLTNGSLVGNDTLTGELARVAGEGAGSYAIGQGTLGNRNYAIGFTGAALRIDTPPVVAEPAPVVPAPVPVPVPVVPAPAPVVAQPAPVVAEAAPVAPVVPAPLPAIVPPVAPAPVVEQPIAATPAPVTPAPAPARVAVAAPYTNIVPELVPPTVGALSYVAVAERAGGENTGGEADGQSLERAASHTPTSGRDVKFLDVMVVSGGINTGISTGISTGNDAAPAAPAN
ncbi:MBG domain-containing protein [Massilia sp. Leaf139]|uniref:MBG domain-containing protein n=1 Tax=Massilia sp. Leaf139 TaxID=1736272 RepID=UPI0006FDC092|nr:MBG domain-containing protein [Massilia sp. Leaf139]KQQ86617.1 hypothetical protein ASF77_20165 [Massilia sp. Leaf139]